MGRGIADYVAREEGLEREKAAPWLDPIANSDLYCHYDAGLVGEGLSLLFAAALQESLVLASFPRWSGLYNDDSAAERPTAH
ncbi:hypothetical protein C8R47DRAFT_1224349 [Mycena vitilis]|nr:hypothetical protein C8R47DRAFT_1224349 [Mycena vitilis]